VLKEAMVINGPINLKGSLSALPFILCGPWFGTEDTVVEELEVPEIVRLAPTVRRSHFDGKVASLNLVPHLHLVQNHRDYRKLTLADMVARKLLTLQDEGPHVGTILV
jgi:hypothetical protein